jgi:electron transfer flavoprotein alpha subunit
MTVLCLVERDGDGVADVSLRALTFARSLAAPTASSAPSAPSAPDTEAQPGDGSASMYQKAGYSAPGGTFMAADGDAAVAAVVFGGPAEVPVTDLSGYGVTDAYAVESGELTGYAPQAWARALAGLAAELSATAVVAAGTDRGHEVMAHLGAITGLPMAANCASAALLTVAVDAVAAVPAEHPARAAVHAYQPALDEADLRVTATESAERSGGVSLATARVVVGGGRGVGGPDGFGTLEELAGLLGGVVGVSRVVTSEGWRPHKQQVGQTGTRISPELYLACGISGAIQHMAGCLSAKRIVAVNTDPDAPIISHADYAVIGDLNQVIPALVAAIRAR